MPIPDHKPSPEQLIRNWQELLQELRVMQTGVQILTGFLLTVPFSARFETLETHQRALYLGVLVGAVLTTCVIVAPVAFHRVLFRRRKRAWLVRMADLCARLGLALLGIVSAAVMLLVFDVVVGPVAAWTAAGGVGLVFVVLWFVVPHLARRE
ncbi:DUF6328 family protein [Myceligenerans indicum]|uniref:Sodium:proton antiporter n=1 Tax=Myceligenerans indicum TaxID=2593663 RepID=A0ABS1LFY4_9MICO|nr:DUF6328 family protein [Myceligenerans indicum]MBL0885147.1 sodium:proton antiporter [Myceligenerans indicum]